MSRPPRGGSPGVALAEKLRRKESALQARRSRHGGAGLPATAGDTHQGNADIAAARLLRTLRLRVASLAAENSELRERLCTLARIRDQDVAATRAAEQRSRELLRQNRRVTRRMFAVQETERRHLARELHDELGQWLAAMQAEAETIARQANGTGLADILEHARTIGRSAVEVHRSVRALLHHLRPALLDELGLADSMRELVDQWRRHRPNVAWDVVIEGDFADLSEDLGITVYRIAQEALSNAGRHAGARHVSLRLCRAPGADGEPGDVLLTVRDDGKGMAWERPSKGLGFLGMRERALAFEGEFRFRSAPGRGVVIEVRLPVGTGERERGNESAV